MVLTSRWADAVEIRGARILPAFSFNKNPAQDRLGWRAWLASLDYYKTETNRKPEVFKEEQEEHEQMRSGAAEHDHEHAHGEKPHSH